MKTAVAYVSLVLFLLLSIPMLNMAVDFLNAPNSMLVTLGVAMIGGVILYVVGVLQLFNSLLERFSK